MFSAEFFERRHLVEILRASYNSTSAMEQCVDVRASIVRLRRLNLLNRPEDLYQIPSQRK